MNKLPRNSAYQPVIMIRKDVVIVGDKIYSFNKRTNINLFNTDNEERVEKRRRLRENNCEENQSK